MRWPWTRRPDAGERPDPERARRNLERVKAQRPTAERYAREIREYAAENNFAAKVFALDPRRR